MSPTHLLHPRVRIRPAKERVAEHHLGDRFCAGMPREVFRVPGALLRSREPRKPPPPVMMIFMVRSRMGLAIRHASAFVEPTMDKPLAGHKIGFVALGKHRAGPMARTSLHDAGADEVVLEPQPMPPADAALALRHADGAVLAARPRPARSAPAIIGPQSHP